jgi:hypothetical protein
MKRIINGRQYNTETAERLGEYEPTPYRSDFHYFCETLYRKKTGEFFLHGEGGPASKYSRSCGQNELCGSESIIPMTYKEAQEWTEEYLDGDDYIAIFGEPDESDEKKTVGFVLTDGAIAKLKQEASKRGITQSALIEELINIM